MRAVSSHEGTCRCNISLGHVPATFSCVCKCCDFVPATCPRYTSLLPVASVCTTQVFVAAACRCDMTPRVCPPLQTKINSSIFSVYAPEILHLKNEKLLAHATYNCNHHGSLLACFTEGTGYYAFISFSRSIFGACVIYIYKH